MRKAEPLAGLGGIALIVSMFLNPYVLEVSDPEVEMSWYRWYGLADGVLVALGLLALAVPVVSLVTRGPAKAVGAAVLASAFGWIAIPIAAQRILTTPEELNPGPGLWIALAGAIVAWVGSWLSLRDESTPGGPVPDFPRLPVP